MTPEAEANLLKRVEALERVVLEREKTIEGLSAQLAHTQRLAWLKHEFPARTGELPVPQLKTGTIVTIEVPTGFGVVMREGQRCGSIIATNGRAH